MESLVRSARERTWRGFAGEGEVFKTEAKISDASGDDGREGGEGGGIAETLDIDLLAADVAEFACPGASSAAGLEDSVDDSASSSTAARSRGGA